MMKEIINDPEIFIFPNAKSSLRFGIPEDPEDDTAKSIIRLADYICGAFSSFQDPKEKHIQMTESVLANNPNIQATYFSIEEDKLLQGNITITS